MTYKYTIYVDESGDANLKTGSRWLCLCGVILEDDYARSNGFYQFDEFKSAVANQLFRRTFRNSKFFKTHVHLGTLTF